MKTFRHYLSSLSQESTTLEQEMTQLLRTYCEKAAKLRYGGIKVDIVDVFHFATGIPDDVITKEDINNCREIVEEFCRNHIETEPIWDHNIITMIWKRSRPIADYFNL